MPHDAARGGGPLPFFEFMLYGVKSFEAAGADARLACVARGRTLTLVPVPSRRRQPAGSAAAADGERGGGAAVVARPSR